MELEATSLGHLSYVGRHLIPEVNGVQAKRSLVAGGPRILHDKVQRRATTRPSFVHQSEVSVFRKIGWLVIPDHSCKCTDAEVVASNAERHYVEFVVGRSNLLILLDAGNTTDSCYFRSMHS